MIGTIRKHSKWMWLVIVTITIFSFVYWGSRSSGSRDSSGRLINFGVIDGTPVTMDEYVQARNEVDLRHFLQTGEWPGRQQRSDYDERRDTYYRILFLRKLKENNIQVDSASVAKVAGEILRGFGGGKSIDLNTFVQRLLAPRGITSHDLQLYIQHDLGIQQLVSVLGLSGKLVTPEEARTLYERDFRDLSTEVAYFNASNHLAEIPTPSADALLQFYTNREDTYRIPERVQVNYVVFSLTNALADAEKTLTNINDLVEMNLQQIGTNWTRLGKSLEEAKKNVREGVIRQQAQSSIRDIRSQADRLVDALLTTPDLATVAKSNGYTVHITAPFTPETGPTEFDGGPNFGLAASRLTPESPVAEQALEGENAFYVITLAKRIPSEVPPLDQIRARVTEDYKFNQAKMASWRAAQAFVAIATNSLASGKSFATICADSKAKLITLSPFAKQRGSVPEIEHLVNPNAFKQTAFQIPLGKISEALPIDSGAVVIHSKELLPLDQARMNKELPEFLKYLRRMRQNEAINDWFAREAQRALRNIQLEPPKSTDQS